MGIEMARTKTPGAARKSTGGKVPSNPFEMVCFVVYLFVFAIPDVFIYMIYLIFVFFFLFCLGKMLSDT